MTATTHRDHGFEHELVLHDGTSQLVDLMVPFIRDGAAAGEGIVVVGELDFVTRLLTTAADVPTLDVVVPPEGGRLPARDLHRFERMLPELERKVWRVRVVNQMPAMTDDGWPEWRRYEAAANTVLAGNRVWGTCAYDTRHLTPGMLSDLRTAHPFVRSPAGRGHSADFANLDARTRDYFDVPAHPVERTEPTVVLVDPTAPAARRVARDLAGTCGLSPPAQESVILATNEVVTNAWVHGRPPVLLRAWAGDRGRVTIAVSDAGTGPDPLVGLVPVAMDSTSGRGMWLVHLLVSDIHHRTSSDGYTVTFTVDGDTALPAAASHLG
jgi:anti-sigma regulatory factor (Ser/Thr protein kinase)